MKKKLFSLLAVMLMSLAANAQKTIIWDYNTIKGIDFDSNGVQHVVTEDSNFPIFSKDGITWSGDVNSLSRIVLKDGHLGFHTTWDWITTLFYSNLGQITSIVITCTDATGFFDYEDEWNVTKTSVSWTGLPASIVYLALAEESEGIQGITQITFTIDEVPNNNYVIYGINKSWKVNGEFTNGMYETNVGSTLKITPITNKVVTSLKVVDITSSKTTYLTYNGDGTWTLPSMPAYNAKLVVGYDGDEPDPGTKYTISNIPSGWKVNGSTTNGTYKAEEGAEVIFTPANIPAGKKIKSIKVVKQ